MKRRAQFVFRSVFDFYELIEHFYDTKILSKEQLDRFTRLCALNGYLFDDGGDQTSWESLCPELPKLAYRKLRELNFRLSTIKVVSTTLSKDEQMCKMVLRLQDGHEIECCIMRFGMRVDSNPGHRQDESGKLVFGSMPRATVCVSSQVGCRMSCSFCATGTMGFRANLTTGEILEQIVLANNVERVFREDKPHLKDVEVAIGKYVRNVVFMGMGEPLDNFDEVVRAIRALTSQRIMAFSPSRITVSTVGFSSQKVKALMEACPRVSLALSLHAPTQALREEIVPVSRQVDIKDLLRACYEFVANQRQISKTNQKRQNLLVEYCLISLVNSTPKVAHELGSLLAPHVDMTMLNVIPYNPTDVSADFKPPTSSEIDAFVKIVRSYQVKVFVRQEFGQEIDGACGQLALKSAAKSLSSTKSSASDESEELITPRSHLADKSTSVPPSPIGEVVGSKLTDTPRLWDKVNWTYVAVGGAALAAAWYVLRRQASHTRRWD